VTVSGGVLTVNSGVLMVGCRPWESIKNDGVVWLLLLLLEVLMLGVLLMGFVARVVSAWGLMK
jgi:hypothetical protein